MLINILTVFNTRDCFNQKAQRQILFDLADLLKELNDRKRMQEVTTHFNGLSKQMALMEACFN